MGDFCAASSDWRLGLDLAALVGPEIYLRVTENKYFGERMVSLGGSTHNHVTSITLPSNARKRGRLHTSVQMATPVIVVLVL